MNKPQLSFWQIINMNVGFFGIQYSFGLQQTAINPIYSFLHATPEQLPLLNLAGPMTGLLIQPIIGAMSDRTWSLRWGRRKPYMLIGAILCSLCLFVYPLSSSLWMAVGLLWILDAANNTTMEPYRALIADKLPSNQVPTGFLSQSFFTGLGITLANVSLYLFQRSIHGSSHSGIPYWVYGSFFIGGIFSITTVLWSLYRTKEIPPTEREWARLKTQPKGFMEPLKDIFVSLKEMPKPMQQLAVVYLFQWYALFCYWQYISHSIALSVWNTSSELNPELYGEAAGWTGLVNGFYNVVTFLTAFLLVRFAKKYSAKIVHAVCLLLAAISLAILPSIHNKYYLFAPMIGFGIAWASIMGVPYIMMLKCIPSKKFGVYMGIINMMIVIPMIIQTLTFGSIYKYLLNSNPCNAIYFAGACLLIASLLVLRITEAKQIVSEE